MKKRALVTGGAEVLGSDRCDRLFAEDYGVIATDNPKTTREDFRRRVVS